MPKTRLMQGNEAIVEGALAAGMRFFAGYPITPSTEIAELCAQKLPPLDGRFIQMEDEIASMAAVIGGSLSGLKSMTATSGPGFSLKQENIGYAAMAEVPCVIVNVQRVGPSTGLPTAPSQGDVMQSRWGTHGDHPIIVLSPTSVLEAYLLMIRAFNLAEKYRTPVIFLTDEIIGHMREKVEIPDPENLELIDRRRPHQKDRDTYRAYGDPAGEITAPMADFGTGFKFHVTGLFHDEFGFPTNSSEEASRQLERLMNKIADHTEDIVVFEEEYMEGAEAAVLAYGGTYRSARAAVRQAREQGLKVGLCKAQTIWPFPEKQVRALAEKVKTIYVPELNMGQYVLEVERVAGCHSRVQSFHKYTGEPIAPSEILKVIQGGDRDAQ